MPGPDDTLAFLRRFADNHQFELDADKLPPDVLHQLKDSADALRQAERELLTLMSLHLTKELRDVSNTPMFVRH